MTDLKSLHRGDLDDRFRIIADTVPAMIWTTGPEPKRDFFNKAWLEFTGRSLPQEINEGWADLLHPDDKRRILEHYAKCVADGLPFEMQYRLKRHDGEYRWIIEKGVPSFGNDGFTGYVGSCMDVQDSNAVNELLEQKVALRTAELLEQTELLREQKEFSDTVFNASIDTMVIYDRDLRFLAINEAGKRTYKLDDSIIGKSLFDIFPQAKDGKGHHDTLKALNGEMVYNEVYKSVVPDLYYEDFLIPLKRKSGEVYAALLIARNITERIEAEQQLKKANDRLQSQNSNLQSSNQELESYNYVASHDLQEPLRKVNMFASRILERDGDKLSEQSKDYFARITSAISRMQNLIQSLLAYSRANAEDIKFVRTDLNKVMKEVVLSLEEAISEKKAEIRFDHLPAVVAVPIQLQQVLHNFVSNAIKYSKPEVAPEISVKAEEVSVEEDNGQKYWKISVADNGIGFDPVYKQKIFELFQRLHGKMEFEGTGVGLAIVRKIADIHKGFVTAHSEPGKGSVFSFYLPVKIKL